MKRNLLSACLLLFLCCLVFSACERPNTQYNLTQYNGHPDISLSSYAYSYIKLFDDGRYYFEYKMNPSQKVFRQSGDYSLNDGIITVLTSDNGNKFLAYINEIITIDGNQITITANMSGNEVTIVFTK